jgi:dolichyl-phosphate beta-glucosyltransferase
LSDSTYQLSIVIPAYGEADRIAATVGVLRTVVEATGRTVEIVVVDDGSPDDTASRARSAGADQVIQLGENFGKGAAVRIGMLKGRGSVRCFVDADLAYSPDQVLRVVAAVEQGADAAVGNRRLDPAGASGPLVRRLGGTLISLLSSWLVLGERRDSQCGIKAFDQRSAAWVFSRTRIDGFGFDVEVLHLLNTWGAAVVDVPVHAEPSEASTVHVIRDGLRLLMDLLVIRYRTRRGDYAVGGVRVEP